MWSERFRRDEEGVALITVMLAAIIIGGLVIVLVNTAFTEVQASTAARDRETAVHVAEAATDDVIVNVNQDLGYHTTYDGTNAHEYLEMPDGSTTTDERAWALEVAENTAAAQMTLSGFGEAVGIRPLDSTGDALDVVFGVGYYPDRVTALAGRGKIRVLKMQVQPAVFSPADALLSNGDLTLGGGASTDGITGNVHANGDVYVEGSSGDCSSSGLCVRGRLSMAGQVKKGPAPGSVMSDSEQEGFDNKHVCPVGDTAPTCGTDDITEGAAKKDVPHFNAISFYQPEKRLATYTDPVSGNTMEAQWWVLCPGGKVFAPTFDGTGTPHSPATICTGTSPVWSGQTNNFHGWYWQNSCGEFANKACWVGDKVISGAYVIHDSNAVTNGGRGAVSVLVTCENTPSRVNDRWDPETDPCGTDGTRNGNYHMKGQPTFVPAITGVHFVADRDVTINGQSGTKIDGFIGAREQVKVEGQGDLNGSVVAMDDDHTTGSPVAVNSAKGSFKVSYNERLLVPLAGVTQIIAWNEL